MTTDLERRLRALRDELPEPPAHIDLAAAVAAETAAPSTVITAPSTVITAPSAETAAPSADPVIVLEPVSLPARRRRRTRWLVAATVAAALAVGVGVAAGIVRSGHEADPAPVAVTPLSAARIDPATQVVRDGDRVRASGQVVAVQGQPVRFCAPTPSTLDLPAVPDPLDDCRVFLEVTGVDLDRLTDRQSFPANSRSAAWVSGYAELEGIFRGTQLTDVVQSAYTAPVPPELPPPPCSPPAGGWPRVDVDASLDPAVADYQQAHPDEIVSVAILQASPTQVVNYVLTARDPAPVEAALAPEVGPALCVVRSRYTPAEIAAADAAIDPTGPLWKSAGVYLTTGPGAVGDDAQPELTAGLPRVTDAALAAVAGLAPGLVQFDPWLTPAR